jgi:hypothetical protein
MFDRQNFAPSDEEMDFMPIVPLTEEEIEVIKKNIRPLTW